MVKNSVTALKQDIGTEFLPVKKTLSLAVIDLMNGVRKDMPQLQTLAGTLADLLSAGISKLGDALQAALPYVQKTLDYVADNGPQVAGILGGLAGTFAAMKFAPLAGNLLEGAGSLLFGESGGLGVAAGGSRKRAGRRAGASAPRRAAAWGVAERAGTQAQQTTNSPPRKPPHHSPSPNSAASVSRVPQAASRPQAPYSVQIAARSINTSRRTVKRGGTGYSECSIK